MKNMKKLLRNWKERVKIYIKKTTTKERASNFKGACHDYIMTSILKNL